MGLFHYTSNAGLVGIIESQSLFATHYRYLNDTQEMDMGRDMIIPILEKDFEAEAESLIASGHLRNEMLADHGRGIYRLEASRLLDIAMKTANNLAPTFITSFCSHEPSSYQWNHGLLSQWRAYGSAGGCAIEFDVGELTTMLEEESSKYRYNHVMLKNVSYESYEDILDVSKLTGLARRVLRRIILDEDVGGETDELYFAIAQAGPQLKHRGFSEERETRVIASLVKASTDFTDSSRHPRKIFFRNKNGVPTPTIQLLEGLGPLPIRRIIIGPQHNQPEISYSIELALDQAGIKAEVVLSEIPYIP